MFDRLRTKLNAFRDTIVGKIKEKGKEEAVERGREEKTAPAGIRETLKEKGKALLERETILDEKD